MKGMGESNETKSVKARRSSRIFVAKPGLSSPRMIASVSPKPKDSEDPSDQLSVESSEDKNLEELEKMTMTMKSGPGEESTEQPIFAA